jgi:O-antigen/teichoic acid export membrane protein
MLKRIKYNLEDKDFAELFNKGGLAFLYRIGGQLLGFLLTFVIAYFFGANGLGEYVLAIVVLRVCVLVAKFGLDTASIKYIAAFASEKKFESIRLFRQKSLIFIALTSMLMSLLMYFNSTFIANLISANAQHIKINAFFILPLSFFMFHYQNLRGLKKIGFYSFFFWMSQALFSLLFILIFTSFSKDSNIPLYAYLSSLIIISIFSFFVFQFLFNKEIKNDNESIENLKIKEILLIASPLMLAQAVQFIMSWTDKIMLGALDTPAVIAGLTTNTSEIGVYHTAFKLSMFATISLLAVKSIAAPKFAELYRNKDFSGLEKVTQQSTKLIFWTTLPLVLVFVFCSEFLMGIFGEEFRLGVLSFIILSAGRLVVAFSGAAGNLLQMCGKQVIFMNVAIIGSLINIILNFVLIPIYGINGSAMATMISIVIFNLLLVYYVKKEFGFYTFYIPFSKKLIK